MSVDDGLKKMRGALAIVLYCTFPGDELIDIVLEDIEELFRSVALEIRSDAAWRETVTRLPRIDNQVVVPSALLSKVSVLTSIKFAPVPGLPTADTINVGPSTANGATIATTSDSAPDKPGPDPAQITTRRSYRFPTPPQTGGNTENAVPESSTRQLRRKDTRDFRNTQSTSPRKRKRNRRRKSMSNGDEEDEDHDDDAETEPEVHDDDMRKDEEMGWEDPDDGDMEIEGLRNEGLFEADLSEDEARNKTVRIETEIRKLSINMNDEELETRHNSDPKDSSVRKRTKKRKIDVVEGRLSEECVRNEMLKEIKAFAARTKNINKQWNYSETGITAEVATVESVMATWELSLSLESTQDDFKIMIMQNAVELAEVVAQCMR